MRYALKPQKLTAIILNVEIIFKLESRGFLIANYSTELLSWPR